MLSAAAQSKVGSLVVSEAVSVAVATPKPPSLAPPAPHSAIVSTAVPPVGAVASVAASVADAADLMDPLDSKIMVLRVAAVVLVAV